MSVESEKRGQVNAGEAAEMLGRLVAFERAVVTGTINALPPVRDQLKSYLAERGL